MCGREFATETALTQHTKDKHGKELEPSRSRRAESSERKSKPRSLRRRNRHPVLIAILIVAILVGVGLYEVTAPSLVNPPFQCLTNESYIHVHPYVRIIINGQDVAIPAEVGFFHGGTCLEPVHTHDASGILHVELGAADSGHNYTLSDFFTIWSATPGKGTVMFNGTSHPVELSSTDVLGYKTDLRHQVVIKVDNVTATDPASIILDRLAYCSDSTSSVPPCRATAPGNPTWYGTFNYPFGTGHTIVSEYVST